MRVVQQCAESQNRRGLLGFRTAAHDVGLAQRQRRQLTRYDRTHTTATRIAHRRRAVIRIRAAQQSAAFGLVRRRGDHDVRNAAHIRHIIRTRVRCPVRTDQTGAVYGEGHIQILQGNVVNDLVIRALREGGVNRQHRLHTVAGNATGKCCGVLLSNAHVKIARWEFGLEFDQARAFAHRRCDANEFTVRLGHIANPATEHLGKGLFDRSIRRFDTDNPQTRIEFGRTVVGNRVLLGIRIAVTFFGDDV